GINFSVFNSENDRFFASYLGNGSRRRLSELSNTRNYLPDRSYITDESRNQLKTDTSHRLNLGLRKQIGEKQNLIMNGSLSYNATGNPLTASTESLLDGNKINSLVRNSDEVTSRLAGSADASYLLKINEGKTILRLSSRAGYSGNESRVNFRNGAEYFDPYRQENAKQFFDAGTMSSSYSASLALTQKITSQSYVDISAAAAWVNEENERKQGDMESDPIPSLSPVFEKNERTYKPGLTWKLNTAKSNLTAGVLGNIGQFTSVLNGDIGMEQNYFFITPRASWEYNYRSGRRLMLDYNTTVNTPGASQLNPVVNNLNPLSLFYGNRQLRPEYLHNARTTWWLFDQFSFTTLLASINARYTENKIGFTRTVNQDLGQTVMLRNTGNAWDMGGMIDFSTAIKPLGLKVNMVLDESYNKSPGLINEKENLNTSFIHRISLTLGNRKKEKWDAEAGSTFTITDSKYSVQKSLNNVFSDISVFTEIRYTPGSKFNVMGSADITKYSSPS
ncbi:MAG TPA: outer membrane beta-barrel protein, partial [Bacteroidales bacterium]|nr:outer membrane beta-barrel protein [Bacteroidales bacterium]